MKPVLRTLQQSEIESLVKVGEMIDQHRDDYSAFFTDDERGKLIPRFVSELSICLAKEYEMLRTEIASLATGIEHIKQIVGAQQELAKQNTVLADVKPTNIVEVAISMQAGTLEGSGIDLIRQISDLPLMPLDQHKVLQILINLLNNARQAIDDRRDNGPRAITIAVEMIDRDGPYVRFQIKDTGVGIPLDSRSKIFSHGFTTKRDGHGFGLHSCANAAGEMGGTLTVESGGRGTGATFTLDIPIKSAARDVGRAA